MSAAVHTLLAAGRRDGALGKNNRQRRAAKKQRRQASQTGYRRQHQQDSWAWSLNRPDANVLAADRLLAALWSVAADPKSADEHARSLSSSTDPVPPALIRDLLVVYLRDTLDAVVDNGWLPSDLAVIAARPETAMDRALLAGLLRKRMRQHPVGMVPRAWRHDLESLGEHAELELRSVSGMAAALRISAVLMALPVIPIVIPPPGGAAGDRSAGFGATAAGIDPQVLGRVRALLAKAESTEFPEEAEALSAKAQQLISRYALDGLTFDRDADAPTMVSARFWIDAPYVVPKAMVVDAVARANRSRSVISEQLGFCTLVGTRQDIEAVELLATSLLIQASTAMARHGAHVDARGRSHTRSFRQSFLVSYATRIGERLDQTVAHEVEASGRSGELVPLLARHEAHIQAAMDEMFPRLTQRETSVTNRLGWAAGQAAADLALLDVRGQIDREVG